MPAPEIYLIGEERERRLPEFVLAVEWLREFVHLVEFDSCATSVEHLKASAHHDPDAIILLQSQSGQLDSIDVEPLRITAPLSDLFLLHGSWCEGETRSGLPPTDFRRLAWYDFVPLISRYLDRLQSEVTPLARTASDPERILDDLEHSAPSGTLRIGVYCESYDDNRAVCESLVAAGHVASRLNPMRLKQSKSTKGYEQSEFDLVIWDDTGSTRLPRIDLDELVSIVSPLPTIALMTFPRIQDVENARRLGASSVIAKPYSVSDLLWQIDAIVAAANTVRYSDASAA